MNEEISIWRIAIEKDYIYLYPEKGRVDKFDRSKWSLYAENIKQLQSFGDSSLLIFEKRAKCEVDKDKRRIFCGKEPKKVMIL